MSVKLNFVPNKTSQPTDLLLMQNPGQWLWGKACKNANNYDTVSYFTTCKDYLIDLKYRRSHLAMKGEWETEQWESNCYYIVFPNDVVYETFLTNVKECLNVYEKLHHFTKTTVTPVELAEPTTLKIVVITGSSMWTKNTCALSFYLSLVRLCGYVKYNPKDLTKVLISKDWNLCNETRYFYSMTTLDKETYNYFYQNPRELTKKPSKKYHITGASTNFALDIGHGASGLFYLLKYGAYLRENASNYPTITTNFFYKKIMEFRTNV